VVVEHTYFGCQGALDLTKATEPIQWRKTLMEIIPHDHWIAFYHEMTTTGATFAIARKPRCSIAPEAVMLYSSDKHG